MSTSEDHTPQTGEAPKPEQTKSHDQLYQEEWDRLKRGEDGRLTAKQFLNIVDETDRKDCTTFNWCKKGKFRPPTAQLQRRFAVSGSTLGDSITDRTVRDHSTKRDGSSCTTGMLRPTSVASVDLSCSTTSRD